MSSIKSAIENILKKDAKKIIKQRAKEIYEECIDIGDLAVSQFYESYVPTQYPRMNSFMHIIMPIWEPTSENGMPAYWVGLRIPTNATFGHKDPEEYVFNGVMNMGVHGTSLIAQTTPPMDIIKDYFAQFG